MTKNIALCYNVFWKNICPDRIALPIGKDVNMSEIKLVLDGVEEPEEKTEQDTQLAVTAEQVLSEVERMSDEEKAQIEAFAEKIDLPEDKIDEAMNINGHHVSVDAPFAEGEDNSLLDIMPNSDSPMADKTLVAESLKAEIQNALSVLNERERNVVEASYGINCPELTLEEIGEKFGLTRERVRQIKEKAIRKLRMCTKNKILKTYLG